MKPSDFRRRILLLVTGMSPQVVTETVYALTQVKDPFVPTEVHLVTTLDGAREARLTLLVSGWFEKLCKTYQLTGIDFGEHSIHVVADADGRELSDIRSEHDNDVVANYITEQIRNFTSDDDAALHVSLAGGRKTMGFFMGYALSLFGRPQDRLSHVLVSEPFESNRGFFFPTLESQTIELRDNKHADAKDAKVMLADIPFVSLRHGYQEGLLRGKLTYLQAVSAARVSSRAPALTIKVAAQRVILDGMEVELAPWSFALLACFAHRAKLGQPAYEAPIKDSHDGEWAESFLADLKAVVSMDFSDQVMESVQTECTGNKIAQHVSLLRSELRNHLGERAYLYISRPRSKKYEVLLDSEAITFER